MPLYDNPPHTADLYDLVSGEDAGGGVLLEYGSSPAQAGIPGLLNTVSASEAAIFAAQGITVSHTYGVKTSLLSVTPKRGMKIVKDGLSYHIEGIRAGQAMGNVPQLTYLQLRQLLE